MVKISVILVDGSYRPHFSVIDSLAEQTFPQDDYEVLWVEYYDKVKNELVKKVDRHPNFSIITLNLSGIYHSSYCFNAGILSAEGELLVIPDADVVVGPDFLESIWKAHQLNDKLVMYVFRYDEPRKPDYQRFNHKDLENTCLLTNPSNYGGCLTVKKKNLMEINGYEQHDVFRTGGDHANGMDVFTRFKNLGLHVMWHSDLKMYHPWHPHKIGYSEAYRLQRILIKHRALNRRILPFQGMDSSQDEELPEALERDLRIARRRSRNLLFRVMRKTLSWIKYQLKSFG